MTHSIHHFLFPAMWLAWAAYWFIVAGNVKTSERIEPIESRLLHVVPQAISFWLLFAYHVPVRILNISLFPQTSSLFWLGASLTAAGLLFTVWARLHIGLNWSGRVTVKENHDLVTSGPYALVRHPIYTGLLLAYTGSIAAHNELRGIMAVLIAWLALWRKYRLEECWMLERFGAEYQAYMYRVPALFPSLSRLWHSSDTD